MTFVFTCINIYKQTQSHKNFKKSYVIAFQIGIGWGGLLRGPY